VKNHGIGIKLLFNIQLKENIQKKAMYTLDNHNNAFLQLLSEAYEKGEKEPGVTVEEMVKELSVRLKSMVESSGK
jgi:hypothetical protein